MNLKHILEAGPIISDNCDSINSLQQKIKEFAITTAV